MAGPLNHVVIAMPRNGTSSFTVDPSTASGGTVVGGAVFNPFAGRMLVCAAYGAITLGGTSGANATPPSGWTKPGGNSGEAVNNGGAYVWYRTATATTADRVTAVTNGSNYPAIFEFWEFENGSTWAGQAFSINVASGGAGPSVAGLTGTNWTCGVMGSCVSATAGTGSVTWANGVEQVESLALKSGTDGYLYSSTAIEDDAATSRSIAATFTAPSGAPAERIMFAVKVAASSAPSGTVNMSGTGALTRAGTPAAPGAVSMAGVGTLTRTATPAVPSAVAMAGAGGMSFTAAPAQAGTAAMAGTGTLTLTGQPGQTSTLNLAGSGVLTAAGTAAGSGAVSLSGVGSLAATGTPTAAGSCALTGAGAFTAAGGSAAAGAATLTGAGALTTVGVPATAGTVGMAGAGQVTYAATPAIPATVAMAGAGGVTIQPPGGLLLSGSGQLTVTGSVSVARAVSLSGSGQLTTTTTPAASGVASFTGAGLLATTGTPAIPGAVVLAGAGQVTTGGVGGGAAVALTGTGTFALAVFANAAGQVDLGGAGTVAIAGVTTITVGVAMAGDGGLQVVAVGEIIVCWLGGTGVLEAFGVPGVPVVIRKKRPRARYGLARKPGPTLTLGGKGPKVKLGGKATIMLDDSCGCATTTTPAPDPLLQQFTVRGRDRAGFDEDGNAVYAWSDLVTGAALEWSSRTEIDETAGVTKVVGTLLIANPGNIPVPETSMVRDSDGRLWDVTGARAHPGSTALQLERLDHDV